MFRASGFTAALAATASWGPRTAEIVPRLVGYGILPVYRKGHLRGQRRAALVLLGLISILDGLALPPRPAIASRWGLEVYGGQPFNFASDLKVEQSGFPRLAHDARWRSEPTTIPVYWALRLSRWQDERGWAVDLMHHKLILENPTAEISSFSVTHGYNLLTLQRLGRLDAWRWQLGAGAVIAHPESVIRGRRWAEGGGLWNGEYLAGAVLVGGVGRDLRVLPRLLLTAEVRASLSRVGLEVEGGDAQFTHLGLHLMIGLELRR